MVDAKVRLLKLATIFFSLCLSITAIESVSTYVGIRVYNLIEVGKSINFIAQLGLERGLIFAFFYSTSVAYLAYLYSIFYLKLGTSWISRRHVRWQQIFGHTFGISFIVLGACGFMNLPAAVNDILAPSFGGGPLISVIPVLTFVFGFFGAFLAIYLLWRKV